MENKVLRARTTTIYAAKLGDKFVYVGCTQKKLGVRISDHLYEARKGKSQMLFHKWLRENKAQVTFEPILSAFSREYGLLMESVFIKEFKTHELDGGLNSTSGGIGFRRAHSSATKNKISKANKKTYASGGPNAGKKFGSLARQNMSKAAEKRMKQVLRLDTGEIFKSLSAVAQDTGWTKTAISRVCNGERNACYGVRFIYLKH